MISGKGTHTNFIVFGLTRSGLEPAIYRTHDETVTITHDVAMKYLHFCICLCVTGIDFVSMVFRLDLY